MNNRKGNQTNEKVAEKRNERRILSGQAVEIAKRYLSEHREAPEGVVYGGATGAVYKYLGDKKLRVQPFEVICLWWIRHRLLIHKSKQEDNMLTDEIKKKIIELRLSGVTNEKTAEITETSVSTVGRIMKEYRENHQGFIDAGECTDEHRKQLTEEITALTDKPEVVHIEPSGVMLAEIQSAKDDASEFDIVNELENMLMNLREQLRDRFGKEWRFIAVNAEGESAAVQYETIDGIMEIAIRRVTRAEYGEC